MPFIQTPTNILRTSFERAPVLKLVMSKQREMLLSTPEERAMVVGDQLLVQWPHGQL